MAAISEDRPENNAADNAEDIAEDSAPLSTADTVGDRALTSPWSRPRPPDRRAHPKSVDRPAPVEGGSSVIGRSVIGRSVIGDR
jgi:hypothetical protein